MTPNTSFGDTMTIYFIGINNCDSIAHYRAVYDIAKNAKMAKRSK